MFQDAQSKWQRGSRLRQASGAQNLGRWNQRWTSTRSPGSRRQCPGSCPGDAKDADRGVPGARARTRAGVTWPRPWPCPGTGAAPAPGSWGYRWLPSGPGIRTRVPTAGPMPWPRPTRLEPRPPRPPRPKSPASRCRSTCNRERQCSSEDSSQHRRPFPVRLTVTGIRETERLRPTETYMNTNEDILFYFVIMLREVTCDGKCKGDCNVFTYLIFLKQIANTCDL